MNRLTSLQPQHIPSNNGCHVPCWPYKMTQRLPLAMQISTAIEEKADGAAVRSILQCQPILCTVLSISSYDSWRHSLRHQFPGEPSSFHVLEPSDHIRIIFSNQVGSDTRSERNLYCKEVVVAVAAAANEPTWSRQACLQQQPVEAWPIGRPWPSSWESIAE